MTINNCLKYIEDITKIEWFITFDDEIGRRFMEGGVFKMSIFLKTQGIQFREYDNCIFIRNEDIKQYVRNNKIDSILNE